MLVFYAEKSIDTDIEFIKSQKIRLIGRMMLVLNISYDNRMEI